MLMRGHREHDAQLQALLDDPTYTFAMLVSGVLEDAYCCWWWSWRTAVWQFVSRQCETTQLFRDRARSFRGTSPSLSCGPQI
jgi:hypothetical protein